MYIIYSLGLQNPKKTGFHKQVSCPRQVSPSDVDSQLVINNYGQVSTGSAEPV